jgi:hypothetical protein
VATFTSVTEQPSRPEGQTASAAAAGGSLDEIKSALEPQIRADYASWEAPEWIGLAIACFHARLDG